MPAVITVVCPKCKKAIQAPDSVVGKRIKCKSCQNVFAAAAEEPSAASAPKPAEAPVVKKSLDHPDEWGEIKAYSVEPLKEKPRCPFCAWELEYADDIVCLHCGYNLQTRERLAQQAFEPLSGMDYFKWHIGPVFCILLAMAAIGTIVFIWVAWELDWGYPWSEAMKVYCSAMCVAVAYFAGKFALMRMIFHPQPPQREKAIDLNKLQEGESKPIRRPRRSDDEDDDDYEDEDYDEEDDD